MQSKLIKQLSFILIFIMANAILIAVSEYMMALLSSIGSPSPQAVGFLNLIKFATRCVVGVAILLSTRQFINMLMQQSKDVKKTKEIQDKVDEKNQTLKN